MENKNARAVGIDTQGAVNAGAAGAVNDGGLGGANGALTNSDMAGTNLRADQMDAADANRAISAAGFGGATSAVRGDDTGAVGLVAATNFGYGAGVSATGYGGFSGLADDVRAASEAGSFDYGGAIDVAKDGAIKQDQLPGATGPMDRDGLLNVGGLNGTSNAATAGLAEDVDRAEIGDAVSLGHPAAQRDGFRYDYDDNSNR